MPTALVIRTAGTNCDRELARAFEVAGASATTVHLDRLMEEPGRLAEADLIGFPGGFSYGDDIASGRLFAMRVRERLYPPLREAIDRGAMVIGVCNGFQVLVQVGVLPGPEGGLGADPPGQTVTLTDNANARFIDDWVQVRVEPESVCVWTRGLAARNHERDVMCLPVANAEGRFVAGSSRVMTSLESNGQVVLRYAENLNGSEGSVAGICDSTGRVFGLMPHPERYLEWNRHPFWTRLGQNDRAGETPGLAIFRQAVEATTHAPV